MPSLLQTASALALRHCLLAAVLSADGTIAADNPPQDSAPATSAAPAEPPVAPDVRRLPPGTILPPGSVVRPGQTLSPGAPGGVVVESPCDYWIVSSRQCQDRGAGGHSGCLSFIHRTSERELNNLGREAFLASVRPDVPLCFVIHGSYNWWRDVVSESRRINRWVRAADPSRPVQVVFFTWPSDGNMPFIFPVDIARLGRKASSHSVYLANLIGQLPPDQPVCLLGHSHGARAAVAALHLLGGGALEDGQALPAGYSTPTHLRAVLIAAAIDHNWLNPGQRYGRALWPTERVLLMRNSRDTTLAIYPLRKGWSERAIGRDGLGREDRLAMDQMGRKVVELDAAQFAGMNHSFADYHEHPELAEAFRPFLFPEVDATGSNLTETARPVEPAGTVPSEGGTDSRDPASASGNPSDELGTEDTEALPVQDSPPDAPPEAKPAGGPKLAPVSLSAPEPAVGEQSPVSGQSPATSAAARDRLHKIMPRSRAGTEGKPAGRASRARTPIRLWLHDE